jgi:hypothetical protein
MLVPREKQGERLATRSHLSMLVYLVGLCQGPDVKGSQIAGKVDPRIYGGRLAGAVTRDCRRHTVSTARPAPAAASRRAPRRPRTLQAVRPRGLAPVRAPGRGRIRCDGGPPRSLATLIAPYAGPAVQLAGETPRAFPVPDGPQTQVCARRRESATLRYPKTPWQDATISLFI